MKIHASPRLLAALAILALLALFPASQARADAVSDARTALVAGEFATAKGLLDPVLLATPANGEAAFLRALARIGIATEKRVPEFATKLGAVSTDVDLGDDTFEINFKSTLVYDTTTALALVNGAYRAPENSNHGPWPAISFENRGTATTTLVLAVNVGSVQNHDLAVGIDLDGDQVGHLYVNPFNHSIWADDEVVSINFETKRVTVSIPAGSAVSLVLYDTPTDASFAIVGTRPATLVVLNGKRVDGTNPKLAPSANFAWFFTFLAQADAETLAPVVADLSVAGESFSMTFAADETGGAQDIVVTHTDTQLLLAELKAFLAVRRLFNSYNLSHPMSVIFTEDGGETLLRNASLLTPKAASATLTAERASARVLFKEALAHYAHASDEGLWTRGDPASGTYLFAIDDEDPESTEHAKVNLETALAQFEAALDGSTPLADLSDHLASDPAIPAAAGLSLAPLFDAPPVNLRGIAPAVGEDGIVRGSSSKLLASGLLPGLGTAGWEQFILSADLADLGTPPRQTGPAIQRQPAALTTVAEGAAATLALAAECYPAPAYQWFERVGATYEPILGATSPTLVFPAVSRADAGLYLCKVTNHRLVPPNTAPTAATISSAPAKLVVTYPPEIVTPPASVARYTGKTVTLTVAAVGVPALRYQWFKGDTAVTPVRATPAYTFLAGTARAGEYHVVVSNERGSVSSETATVDVQTKPVFTTQPTAQTVPLGSLAFFTVVATGNPAPQIKWRKDGKDLPGKTGPTLMIDQTSLADRGVYTAVAFSTVQTGPSTTAIASTVSTGARLGVAP